MNTEDTANWLRELDDLVLVAVQGGAAKKAPAKKAPAKKKPAKTAHQKHVAHKKHEAAAAAAKKKPAKKKPPLGLGVLKNPGKQPKLPASVERLEPPEKPKKQSGVSGFFHNLTHNKVTDAVGDKAKAGVKATKGVVHKVTHNKTFKKGVAMWQANLNAPRDMGRGAVKEVVDTGKGAVDMMKRGAELKAKTIHAVSHGRVKDAANLYKKEAVNTFKGAKGAVKKGWNGTKKTFNDIKNGSPARAANAVRRINETAGRAGTEVVMGAGTAGAGTAARGASTASKFARLGSKGSRVATKTEGRVRLPHDTAHAPKPSGPPKGPNVGSKTRPQGPPAGPRIGNAPSATRHTAPQGPPRGPLATKQKPADLTKAPPRGPAHPPVKRTVGHGNTPAPKGIRDNRPVGNLLFNKPQVEHGNTPVVGPTKNGVRAKLSAGARQQPAVRPFKPVPDALRNPAQKAPGVRLRSNGVNPTSPTKPSAGLPAKGNKPNAPPGGRSTMNTTPPVEGRGKTVNPQKLRFEPRTMREKLAVSEAKKNPAGGKALPLKGNDQRWPTSAGWQKMARNINPGGREGPVEVHYQYNSRTGAIDDFKIVDDKAYAG
jgi:hypothetical protein